MPNNIGFRITGMYFGARDGVTNEIRVNVEKPEPTVYDVMVEVARKVRAGSVPGVDGFQFDPLFPTEIDSLKAFYVRYIAQPKSGRDYLQPGIYFLQENKMGNPYYVWQYYIFSSPDFKQKNNNNQTAQFNAKPDVPIEDNDIIVWRQVAIMQSANGSGRIAAEMASGMSGLRKRKMLE